MPLLFLTLVLLQTPSAPPRDVSIQSEPHAGKCVLRGRVLDSATGQPIKGATLTLVSQGGREPLSTATDAGGRWEIGGLPAGEYHLTASKAGYVDGGISLGRSIGLTETSPERTVDLKLVRGAVLSGRITDADGEPLAGIHVMALRDMPTGPGRRGWGGVGGGSSTDDRGQFRVFGLAAGDYVLAAQRQDRSHTQSGSKGNRLADVTTYYPGTATLAEAQRFSVGDGAEYSDLTFALQALPSISVSGRVVVSADRIRHGFGTMMPQGDRVEFMMGGSGSMMLEPAGSFRIHGVTPGSYRLSVQVELTNGEREVGHLEVAAGDEDISGLVLSTHGPTTITGRVVLEPAGAQRPEMMSISAMAIGNRINFGGQETVVVKPDGTFELKVFDSPVKLYQSGRLEGWVQSGARWKGHDVRGGLTFDVGQAVEGVELVLRRATSRITGGVSGTVRASGGDAEGTVIAFGDGGEDPAGVGIVGIVPVRDGRFTLGPMSAGAYQVVAVRAFDQSMFGKPDVIELLRTRGTEVSVGENETKTVTLTLITDH